MKSEYMEQRELCFVDVYWVLLMQLLLVMVVLLLWTIMDTCQMSEKTTPLFTA